MTNYNSSDIIPALNASDILFQEISHCLYADGTCELFQNYADIYKSNVKDLTGFDIVDGMELGKPPNYYPSILDWMNGQSFVHVGNSRYGAYTGMNEASKTMSNLYGNNSQDSFLVIPSVLESVIHGLLDEFLGNSTTKLSQCNRRSDCSTVNYCSSVYYNITTCSGKGKCVCSRARFHPAMDEAIEAQADRPTGFFKMINNDNASAIYTEPYWDPGIGVYIYRSSNTISGYSALGSGLFLSIVCIFCSLTLRKKLKSSMLF